MSRDGAYERATILDTYNLMELVTPKPVMFFWVTFSYIGSIVVNQTTTSFFLNTLHYDTTHMLHYSSACRNWHRISFPKAIVLFL